MSIYSEGSASLVEHGRARDTAEARDLEAGVSVSYVTDRGGAVDVVKHDMGKIPTSFSVVSVDQGSAGVTIYRDSKEWDETNAYLRASAPNRAVTVRFV